MNTGVLTCVLLCTTMGLSDFQSGKALYATGRYLQASRCFREVVRRNPNSAIGHYYYANCLFKISRKDEAFREYEKVRELSPDSKIGQYSGRMTTILAGQATRLEPEYPFSEDSPVRHNEGDSFQKVAIGMEIDRRLARKLPQQIENVEADKHPSGQNVRIILAKWRTAEKNLALVEKLVAGLPPVHRLHGESTAQFKSRKAIYQERASQIVTSYQKNAADIEKIYRIEKAKYRRWSQSNRGTSFTGLP